MKLGNFKGALLEYIVRKLLLRCGFSNVKSDGIYAFERSGLYFLNGKGAAHDADVIMNPPIQMPFTYPTQLIFECKAYGGSVGLPIIRNAHGFRLDINEFEVVTLDSLDKRKNNSRAEYAIEQRNRFLYQVGVASINGFTKPAVEFAANNKIPLLSISWFLSNEITEKINEIKQIHLNRFGEEELQNLYDFFKDREGNLSRRKYSLARNLINKYHDIGEILDFAHMSIEHSYVGLLETGDLIFLFPKEEQEINVLNNVELFSELKAEIHWYSDIRNVWLLTVRNSNNLRSETEFYFYVPDKILKYWANFNFDKNEALNIKEMYFSRIFIFNGNNKRLPFVTINIDNEWLNRMRYN